MYEYVKLQSTEGYEYTPSGNRFINFDFDGQTNGIVDLSKSYLVLNTTLNATGNTSVFNVGLGANSGEIDYHPVCMIRNCRWMSKSTPEFYVENRYTNIRAHNELVWLNDLSDNEVEQTRGMGWSREDKRNGIVRQSIFAQLNRDGSTTSSSQAADALVSMKYLWGRSLGEQTMWPMALLSEQNMEFEVENVQSVVSAFTLPALNCAGGTATANAADEDRLFIPSASLKKDAEDESECPYYVGQAVKITYTLSVDGAQTVYTKIKEIDVGGSGNDAFGRTSSTDGYLLTFDDKIVTSKNPQTVTGTGAGQIILIDDSAPTSTSFTINRAELILARVRMPVDEEMALLNNYAEQGLVYQTWLTTSWNRDNATDVNEYWQVAPRTLMYQIAWPTNYLYSQRDGATAYRTTVGDMDQTDRDVTYDAATHSGLYRHKLMSAWSRAGNSPKNVLPQLEQALSGDQSGSAVAATIQDILPNADMVVPLKLRLRGSGMTTGPAYLFTLQERHLKF